MTAEWRQALRDAVARTRQLFRAGAPVADGVRGRLRWELRATWLGGTRILDKLEAVDYDVFTRRPALTRADLPGIFWHTLFWATDRHG
jgi:phytoene/squalene synthetase